jgi:hypothetical protein
VYGRHSTPKPLMSWSVTHCDVGAIVNLQTHAWPERRSGL